MERFIVLSINTTIGELLENEQARGAFAEAAPSLLASLETMLSAGGQTEMMKGISIPTLRQFKADICTGEELDALDAKLQAL